MATRSAKLPVWDASETRDPENRYYELSDWFVAQCIGVMSILDSDAFWIGNEADILAARDDVREQIERLILGADVQPSDFNPEFEIQGTDLMYRPNAASPWENKGRVVGFDGQTPQLTVSAHGLAHNLAPTASIDGTHIDFGIPQGQPGQDGQSADGGSLWQPPEITSNDQLCSAAKIMGDVFSDRLQDSLENIDAITTVVAQSIDAALDLIGSIIPIGVPQASSIIEFGFEAVTEPMIDYVRENVYDLQARALVRDEIYCAMLAAPEPDQWVDYVDWTGAAPVRDFSFSDPLKAEWLNMNDWIQWIWDAQNGTLCGWMTLAFTVFMTKTIDHLVNIDNSSKAILGYALNTASYGDAADCATADCDQVEWCHVFDFTQSAHGFEPADGYANAWQSGVGWIGQVGTHEDRNYIKLAHDPAVRLTEIQFTIDQNGGENTYAYICQGDPAVQCAFGWSDTDLTTFTKAVNNDYSVFSLGMEQGTVTYKVGNIIAVQLRGTGANPFGEDNCGA